MVVKWNGVVIGCVSSADLTITAEIDEATCSDSLGYKEFTAGQKSWSASINSLYREFDPADPTAHLGFEDAFDALDDGAMVELEFGKRVAGGYRYTGSAYVSELKYTQPEKGSMTWSASFTGSGPIVKSN